MTSKADSGHDDWLSDTMQGLQFITFYRVSFLKSGFFSFGFDF